MKRMKNAAALLLALMMMLSLSVTAFADGEELGSIEITGVSTDNVYEIYQLLVLESYNPDSKAYAYKVNEAWEDFFETSEALHYVQIDAQGYVTWIAGDETTTDPADFAKLALAYAKEEGIDPLQSSEDDKMAITTNKDGKNVGTFSNLPLGYYLVDSTMGALCGLTTTNPTAYIIAKNDAPTIHKQVKEDTTDYGPDNNAQIGETVEFRTTIHVSAGAEKYILHDKMSDGLTFKNVSSITKNGVEVPSSNYTVLTGDDLLDAYEGTDKEATDICTFEVRFDETYCSTLNKGDTIIVYYSAVVNENAVIYDNNAKYSDENTAQLEFGEDHFTETSTTKTYTYALDLVKTDGEDKLIDGAAFRLYGSATGSDEIPLVKLSDTLYRLATPEEAEALETAGKQGDEIVVKDGLVRIVGFDAQDTYYLEETQTPSGYNKLSARQSFTTEANNMDASVTNGTLSTGSGVQVKNQSGSRLPETGGMGTTLFVTFGAIAVLGTGVLLVTKKRMGMIQD